MERLHQTYRIPADVVERVTAYAADRGMTKSAAVAELLEAGLTASEGARDGREDRDAAEMRGDSGGSVLEVLRASNADLRAEISRLWAQMAEKDRQIAEAHGLADQAHKLHAAEVSRSLPAAGVRDRIRILFHRDGR